LQSTNGDYNTQKLRKISEQNLLLTAVRLADTWLLATSFTILCVTNSWCLGANSALNIITFLTKKMFFFLTKSNNSKLDKLKNN